MKILWNTKKEKDDIKSRRRSKRGTAVILTAVLAFFGFILPLFLLPCKAEQMQMTEPAKEMDEDGTVWYRIGTAQELYWFSAQVNSMTGTSSDAIKQRVQMNAKITQDIVVNENVADGGSEDASDFYSWIPIGNQKNAAFYGDIDGQGHTIRGLYINDSLSGSADKCDAAGFVGIAGYKVVNEENSEGTKKKHYGVDIKNLKLKDCCFIWGKKTSYAGGIIAEGIGSTLTNCSFSGKIQSLGTAAGGLMGSNGNFTGNGSNSALVQYGAIRNCNCNITLSNAHAAGGLVGQNNGVIDRCFVEGTVTGLSSNSVHGFTGGLVGANAGTRNALYGKVINCYSNAKVGTDTGDPGGEAVGVLAGRAGGGYFINCYGIGLLDRGIGTVYHSGVSENTGKEITNYYYEQPNADGGYDYGYYDICINCYCLGSSDSESAEYPGLYFAADDSFSSAKVAYALNHNYDKTKVFQEHRVTVEPVFGQKIGEDFYPVFLNAEKSNEVHRIIYQGDYSGLALCNDTVVLPECEESGSYYEFISTKTGKEFDGKGIDSDDTVTVNKLSKQPSQNAKGYFEIMTPEQMEWFIDYVNEGVPLSTENPYEAKAILLKNIDMAGYSCEGIGIYDSDATTQEEAYKRAFRGIFDGQYHTISHLNIEQKESGAGLFRCTYGALVMRVGLEDSLVKGQNYVGSVVARAAGTVVKNCYYTGGIIAAGDFVGGLIGYSEQIENKEVDSFPSHTLKSSILYSYVSASMTNTKKDAWMAGICGGIRDNGAKDGNLCANCYYNKEISGVDGAVWNATQNRAVDDDEKDVLGFTTEDFQEGKVTWQLQQVAMEIGEDNVMGSTYEAVDVSVGSNGISMVTYRSNALIWCQNLMTDTTPKFADGLSDAEKAKNQVKRFAAINGETIYCFQKQNCEQYFNRTMETTLPEGNPVYSGNDIQSPHYFAGWTKNLALEAGKTLLKKGEIITKDTYYYAYYDTIGTMEISCKGERYEWEYGRAPSAADRLEVTVTGSVATTPLTYQWYECGAQENGSDVLLQGENGSCYIVPVTLNAGTHSFYCKVTAANGTIKNSPKITVVITKKPLNETMFKKITPCYYTSDAVKPEVTVASFEEMLLKDTDYTLSYDNNVQVTTAEVPATVVVRAKEEGNYSGSVSLAFSISYLKADSSMYQLEGVLDEDGYYVDQVKIVPQPGYEFSRTDSGEFSEKGITFRAMEEFDTYRVSFHIRDRNDQAVTDAVNLTLKVKQTKITAPKEEEQESQDKNLSDVPSFSTSENSFCTSEENRKINPQVKSEIEEKKDKFGETISYFDGLYKPKVGKTYVIGNYKYKITKSTQAGGEVALIKLVNKKRKKSNIPIFVTINGFHYNVTSIGKKAFYKAPCLQSVFGGSNIKTIGTSAFSNCCRLKSVTVGKNVIQIGSKAFSRNKKLQMLTISSKKIKKLGKNVLQKVPKKLKINVPANCKKKYTKLLRRSGLSKQIKIKEKKGKK